MQHSAIAPRSEGQAPVAILKRAARFDRFLRLPPGAEARLEATRLRPTGFSPAVLFAKIATQSPVLFDDFPSPVRDPALRNPGALEPRLLSSGSRTTHPVRFGSGDAKRDLTVSEIMKRWRVPGAVLGVTDLPVRGGDLEEIFDTDFLAPWNLMADAPPSIKRLETLTAVFSTAGKLTDSHSDDMAVCNHCCTGSKLWLAWDTHEGLDAGLEDVERVTVHGRARFSMSDFLSLPSAHWFTVGPGQTIFLPGKFTHRVYTLDNYIGVGSFYVGYPNLLHTAARWFADGSLWDDGAPGHLARALLDTGLASLAGGSSVPADKGGEAMSAALAHFEVWTAGQDVRQVPALKQAVAEMRRLCKT